MTGGAGLTGGSGYVEVKSDSISEGSSDFDLESDGSQPFYMLDAYEEFYGPNMGTVYLFGKVNMTSFML
ncbi:putative DNA-directed DNA polymerase [Rosa chinensis]|uniref:Putative DNA-directed DNA polymerase n=1 Tax=Rosa chinensis TaxID=74649 RepID=A0A2P6RPK5_ROSCH|nr:putative DNA-directed DNA polymerase [Rosa chinensis]